MLGVGGPVDVKCLASPYLLEETRVLALRNREYDARGVGETMFLRIDNRVLRLLRIGILQLVSGGAQIPEVAAIKILLRLVVIESRVER